MILRHTKKKMTIYIVLSIVWTILAVISFINDESAFTKYGYGLVAILNTVVVILYKTRGYAYIKDGILSTNDIKKKQITLANITAIQKKYGDILLVSPSSQVGLDPNSIRPEDWQLFLNLDDIKRLDTSNI